MVRTAAMCGGVMVMWALAACAGAPAAPSQGGPAWLELTSEHFTVWTDAGADGARRLIRQMERFRRVMLGAAFPTAPSGGRTLVILLHDDDELTDRSPTRQPRPYARARPPLLQQSMIVLAASRGEALPNEVAHELTHAISFSAIHHQPRWFSEGMAQFFETVQVDPDRATCDIGRQPEPQLGRGPRRSRPPLGSLAQLFAWGAMREEEAAEYNTSWWLFGFLFNHHRDELARYAAELETTCARGCDFSPERQAELWGRAFPSLPVAAVDSELRRWIYGGSHLVLHINVAPRDVSITERKLGDADAYAVRGMLHVLGPADLAKARGELATALSLDPRHVLARLFVYGLDGKSLSVPDGRALVAAHRDDWRAWWLLTDALETARGEPDELAAARATACGLAAQNPAVEPPRRLCGPRGDATAAH